LNYNSAIRPTDGHPIDALIAAFAAKTLSAPLMALVAAHLELKPENRAYAAALEAVHGVFLEELRPVPLAGRDRRLVNIFASPEPPPAPSRRAHQGASSALPRALRRLAGCDLAELAWTKRCSGLKEAPLRDADHTASFFAVRPGSSLAVTGEDGPTAVLVLAGCASDRNGDHVRGDIIFVDHAAHGDDTPVAKGASDCICFVVAERSIRAPGPLRRTLQRVIGG
jgi:predicted ChrR family anti-sigma factor